MLIDSLLKIICNTNIEGSISLTCKNVDKSRFIHIYPGFFLRQNDGNGNTKCVYFSYHRNDAYLQKQSNGKSLYI